MDYQEPNVSTEQAHPEDLTDILKLFDQVQAWLIASGLAGQWGTEPFSESELQRERFSGWLEHGLLYALCNQDRVVGSLVINPEIPSYAKQACEQHPKQALYLEAFAVHPNLRGKGLGGRLLEFAEREAERQNIGWLRLDCWADNNRLKRYYLERGYREFAQCELGTWRGAVFEKRIA